ncbi:helix-turn-helix domain-containing protein [Clostridium beijerinckii]|uniref:helix-turn-helix domain-containing protein n=1 Tax=Clostridium beijerinckii TaxID=1520 RepID=UPI001493E130|nr:transcriptional regulator with XRE-family HTH domain [Clostridium beijerinckii]NYC05649.1 transcriptional regulator with XRE-family HTH domain [Clostridium beijerinckii]
MTLGEKIRSARVKESLSQRELGQRVNLSDSAICRYENNNRKPKGEVLKALRNILDIEI